jgi:mono/diheme cytochrome c family protein
MRTTIRIAFALLVLVVVGVVAVAIFRPGMLPQTAVTTPVNATTAYLARGEYLARAGDCVACHTMPGGREFAGGRAMPTPFGNLYVPNITPDDETGIGKWSADDFYRTMHSGLSRDGTLLYPAMPFASYTKVTREDSDAMYAYLMSAPPIRQRNRPHELRFPYDKRDLLIGWRALYFKEGEYVPDPKQSSQWNRGAYLVQGLGHCSMCHTAINVLGGSSESKAFEGGSPTELARALAYLQRQAGLAIGASRTSATCCRWASRIAEPCTVPWPRSSTTACSIFPTRTSRPWRFTSRCCRSGMPSLRRRVRPGS